MCITGGKKGPVKEDTQQIQLDNISSSHLHLSQYCLHHPSEGDGVAHLPCVSLAVSGFQQLGMSTTVIHPFKVIRIALFPQGALDGWLAALCTKSLLPLMLYLKTSQVCTE